jgi:HD superfamily phosphohydrolase
VLIDSPLIQRLRRIHQTGLAYYVYPATRHSRFEHSLGVVNVATRVFDALAQRYAGKLEEIANHLYDSQTKERGFLDKTISRWRQELRLAGLLHDTGHSILSHASERVYSKLGLLEGAANELSEIAAADKKAGEALSYCLAKTEAVSRLLARAKEKLIKECDLAGEYADELDMQNVCLLIIGRARHPLLHFLGDIISSGFDADKLDYLLRDATAAGLPLRYDLERYLSTVYL